MTTEATTRPALAYRTGTVHAVRDLTPRLRRVTFTGADLRDVADAGPDQYVKVFFPTAGTSAPQLPALSDDTLSWYRTYLALPDAVRPPMRTYTVRAARPEIGEVDIDFVRHADPGPGSSWAEAARPGDEVAFLGPHGLYSVPSGASWQLLVGDETAVPAISAILERLPEQATARVFVEVADAADEIPLPGPATGHGDVRVDWVHRDGAAPGEAVLDAVRRAELPGATPYAWLAGEAGLVKHTRRHLVRDRGVDKRAITFTGYWRRGRTEEDAGRERLRRHDRGETDDGER